MKSPKRHLLATAAALILLLSPLVSSETTVEVSGEYIKASCDCTCKGKTIKSEVVYKQGSMLADGLARFFAKAFSMSANVVPPNKVLMFLGLDPTKQVLYYEIAYTKLKCGEQCAKSCGGYTLCDRDCGKCCSEYVSKEYKYDGKKTELSFDAGTYTIDPEGYYIDASKRSCFSACTYKSNIRSINEVILYVVGVAGAIMLALNGLRFMGSENPDQRAEAKRGLKYTVIAIIIIMLSSLLVSILMESAMTPAA